MTTLTLDTRPEPLAYRCNMEYGEVGGSNDGKNTDFWISRESTIVPTHVAFEAKGSAQVKALHRAALAAGATDNGGPGYRNHWPGYYAAFAHDPDGHNIEAVWYNHSKVKWDQNPSLHPNGGNGGQAWN